MIKKIKKLFLYTLLLGIIIIGFVLFAYYYIGNTTQDKLYDDVSQIPKNKVGLVLGTSKFLQSGYVNLYYQYRIDATVALYKAGKIDYVLISGDNGSKAYDEPTTFKMDLIALGIPEDHIYLDYAGFRTWDSVIRCNKIFGQESVTFISQEFHNARAVYIASHFDIDAVGFNAKDVSQNYGLKTQIREYLARTKVFWDILWGKEPKYLGEKVLIP